MGYFAEDADICPKHFHAFRLMLIQEGSCHGGWCWKRVTNLLRKDGHEVYAPTLTGLGERSHLVSRDIGLDTHILDIIIR